MKHNRHQCIDEGMKSLNFIDCDNYGENCIALTRKNIKCANRKKYGDYCGVHHAPQIENGVPEIDMMDID